MKAEELREQKVEDLLLQRERLLKELFELRFKRATEKLEQSHRLGNVRREIARIMTVINEKKEVEKKGSKHEKGA